MFTIFIITLFIVDIDLISMNVPVNCELCKL